MATADLKMSSNPITSHYGTRILNGHVNFHKGTDFAYSRGAAIPAWGAGTVTHFGWSPVGSPDRERGIWVEITHAPGIKTSYHSMNATPPLSIGQSVKMGQIIGTAGMTAVGATGAHLHAGLWINGQHVDAEKYLKQGEIRTVSTGASAGGGSTPIENEEEDMTPDQAKSLSNVEANLAWVVNAIQDPVRGLAARVAKIEESQTSASGNIRYLVNASQTPETGIEARLAKIQGDIQNLAASGGDLDGIEDVIVNALKSVSYRAI